ncbi:MAG: hypothetical protein HY298_18560 [Verrucomicrobia bacterium]|nr:hypothetical protein [Verrucomicrobiota bacterium]
MGNESYRRLALRRHLLLRRQGGSDARSIFSARKQATITCFIYFSCGREPPRHCGHCVPCLIRRAAIQHGFGGDDTDYSVPNLTAQPLSANKANGRDVRSLQLVLARLEAQPQLAKVLIHKPGPLSDFPAQIPAYERMFLAGMKEISKLARNIVARVV